MTFDLRHSRRRRLGLAIHQTAPAGKTPEALKAWQGVPQGNLRLSLLARGLALQLEKRRGMLPIVSLQRTLNLL